MWLLLDIVEGLTQEAAMASVQSACAALPVTTWTVEGTYSCSVFALQGCGLQLRADLESRAQELLPTWSCEDLLPREVVGTFAHWLCSLAARAELSQARGSRVALLAEARSTPSMRVPLLGSGVVGKGDKEMNCERYHIEGVVPSMARILETSVPS